MKKKEMKVFNDPKVFILLYLMYSKDYRFYLATRIQKAFFIFKREFISQFKSGKDNFTENFRPHFFGPYSSELDNSLIMLEKMDFIKRIINLKKDYIEEINKNESKFDEDANTDLICALRNEYYSYELNSEKINYFNEIIKEISSNVFENIEEKEKFFLEFKNFVDLFNNANINSILEYVYKKYPEFTSNSLIREKILNEK